MSHSLNVFRPFILRRCEFVGLVANVDPVLRTLAVA
ncbi:hypothetical protein JOD55_001394 [Arcanobacterium pluranimalium]|nr:hypothetical protein [Arcanobacterium pluranimalium]